MDECEEMNMSEDLAERVAYLEREARRTSHAIDGVDERADIRLQVINLYLKEQDKRLEDSKENVDKRFECVDGQFVDVNKKLDVFRESVEKRFDYVDEQLANINANIIDIRNILADFIAKNY
jgi:hypothetical protein